MRIGIPLASFILVHAFLAQGEQPGRQRSTLERIEPARLEATRQARMRFQAQRKALARAGIYEDYRAIIHLHAEDAPHTGGTRAEVLQAAQAAGVSVVMFTDHNGPKPETWHGMRDGILFLRGGEGGGVLRFPATGAGRELRFLSHVEERLEAPGDGLDGLEIYNRHADQMDEEAFLNFFRAAAKYPAEWQKLVGKMKQYPDELFGASCDYWPSILGRWDAELGKRKFTGVAANDSHQNQLYQGTLFDPYEVSFRNVSTHILARELSEADIRQSLGEGHAYVAHDWLADPAGFSFTGANNLGLFEMGDSIPMTGTTRLTVQTPVAAHIKLIQAGKVVAEGNDVRLTYESKAAGAYRAELWLEVDGEERPWIYANPIYLEPPSLEALKLLSQPLSGEVDVRKDITYTEGKPEDAAKHKLDLYVPKGKSNYPVLFFVHGGAWRSGDRSRYAQLGNRFAKEGIGTVAISYRLAPRNPHPAQIEDVAAAFAWTVKNIRQHGGDPDRIYIGGHSAGAHLVALVALDGRYLKAHGLSAANIRGVAALSGVFEIRGLDSVFGTDEIVKREASPLGHVKAPAPPFLVTYCQWDYATLPAQAKAFHAALEKAGVKSELLFVPKESHISEIISVLKDDDPTARAMLRFVR